MAKEVILHVDFSDEAIEKVTRLYETLLGVPISVERKERMLMAALESGLLIDGVPSPTFTMLTRPDEEV